MALKTVVKEVTTAGTKVQLFTTTTLAHHALVGPHGSNTGIIRWGDTTTQQLVLRTGDNPHPLSPGKNDFFDLSEIFVVASSISNQVIVAYLERP